MTTFDFNCIKSLAPVILWQYDKAENIQKLIYRVVEEIGEDGAYASRQVGILQRALDMSKEAFDEFFRLVFCSLEEIEKYPGVEAVRDDEPELKKIVFGISLWSRIAQKARPVYQPAGASVPKPVSYLAWARIIKAELYSVFSRGSCKAINEYLSILLPNYSVYVVDNGLVYASDYMTEEIRYRPNFVYSGYVKYRKRGVGGEPDTFAFVRFVIDTRVTAEGASVDDFAVVAVSEFAASEAAPAEFHEMTRVGEEKTWIWEDSQGQTWSWSRDDGDGLYKLNPGEPLSPAAYFDDNWQTCVDVKGAPKNALFGAPDIKAMMEKQLADEYQILQAEAYARDLGNDSLFPHPAGVLVKNSSADGYKLAEIPTNIGLNTDELMKPNAMGSLGNQYQAVLDHGVISR